MNPASLLRKASTLEQEGRHGEAATLYRELLQKFPLREDANRGLLSALEASGAQAELEATARALLEKLPRFLPAWLCLARVLLIQQKDALAACQTCVKLDPKNPGAYDFLGIALRRTGQLEDAASALKTSLRLRPGSLSTRANLANVWREMGRLNEALPLYAEVLAAEPQRLDARYNYCLALSDLGQMQEAERQLRQLLEQAPGLAEAHNALGSLLQTQSRLGEAEQAFKTALSLQPQSADALCNLLLILHKQSKFKEMRPLLGRTVALMPHKAAFRLAELVFALPKMVASSQEAEQALQRFDADLAAIAHWREGNLQAQASSQEGQLTLPFALAYRQGNHLERLARFAALSAPRPMNPPARTLQARGPGAPLRLGIVSAHIRRHSVWDIVLKGLIQHLDPQAFELTIYHLGHLEDAETQFAKSAVPRWRDASSLVSGSGGWAGLIAKDAQDVLYYPELGMDTLCYRLAQQRLAPLQAAGWGHPITTGIASVDLFFSGELIEPEGAQSHYSEALIKLPGTGCCTQPYEAQTRPSAALDALFAEADGAPVFLIPQSLLKFDPDYDFVYAEIARRLGACRFAIPVDAGLEEATEVLRTRLAAAFAQQGLDANSFVRFLPWLNEGEFKQALQLCTVFLDCPAFSGYTTAWKALREGIPIVTWEGPMMRQRLAAGLLRKVGMSDGVVNSMDAYIAKAVALAQEPSEAHQARRHALAAAAPLADHDVAVVRAFERELQQRVMDLSSAT